MKIIKYDRMIYSASVIRRAVEAFQNNFDVSVLKEYQNYVEVQFRFGDHIEKLIGEFNNYLIQLENQNGLDL